MVVLIFDATGRMSRQEMRRPLEKVGLRVTDTATTLDICRSALNGSLHMHVHVAGFVLYKTRVIHLCPKKVPLFLLRLSSIPDSKTNEMQDLKFKLAYFLSCNASLARNSLALLSSFLRGKYVQEGPCGDGDKMYSPFAPPVCGRHG